MLTYIHMYSLLLLIAPITIPLAIVGIVMIIKEDADAKKKKRMEAQAHSELMQDLLSKLSPKQFEAYEAWKAS